MKEKGLVLCQGQNIKGVGLRPKKEHTWFCSCLTPACNWVHEIQTLFGSLRINSTIGSQTKIFINRLIPQKYTFQLSMTAASCHILEQKTRISIEPFTQPNSCLKRLWSRVRSEYILNYDYGTIASQHYKLK